MEAMNNKLCSAMTKQFIDVSKFFDCMDWLCKPFYSKRRVFLRAIYSYLIGCWFDPSWSHHPLCKPVLWLL